MGLNAVSSRAAAKAVAIAVAAAMAASPAGAGQAGAAQRGIVSDVIADIAQVCEDARASGPPSAGAGWQDNGQKRVYAPLTWDVDSTRLVGRQGTTRLWGTCGECAIANTLNLVTGSALTEADVVGFAVEHGLCDPATGGMTLDDMTGAYTGLLPLDRMDVFGYGGDYAPTIEEMAGKLESGMILNVGVYGEMMREGGHVGEGEVQGTHWIVLHGAERAADGSVAGFGVVDSASDITYLGAQELSDVYYGHDGTTVTDPACIEVYGWKRAR